jgi:hypothetical protein
MDEDREDEWIVQVEGLEVIGRTGQHETFT